MATDSYYFLCMHMTVRRGQDFTLASCDCWTRRPLTNIDLTATFLWLALCLSYNSGCPTAPLLTVYYMINAITWILVQLWEIIALIISQIARKFMWLPILIAYVALYPSDQVYKVRLSSLHEVEAVRWRDRLQYNYTTINYSVHNWTIFGIDWYDYGTLNYGQNLCIFPVIPLTFTIFCAYTITIREYTLDVYRMTSVVTEVCTNAFHGILYIWSLWRG